MTVTEYLIELEEELKFLPKKKRESTLIVYREKINNMIDYGDDEEKITSSLPKPSEIAANLYETEGIDFLTKRKRQAKQKETFKAILSAVTILLLVSAAIVLSVFIIKSIINITTLVFKLKGLLEIVITSILVLSYILVLLLVLLYLLDLLHVIFNLLLENVLVPFKKNPKFLENSLMDYIDNFTKKPKIFGKVLGITTIILILFIGIGYFTKTYFYRSVTSDKPTEYVETIDLTDYKDTQKLLIDIDSANIIISKGEEFSITVSSEFKRSSQIKSIGDTIQFETDNLKEFDFIGLLTEPIPYIEITIPHELSLVIKTTNGMIQLENLNLKDINLTTTSGNIVVYDTKVNQLKCVVQKGGINLTNIEFHSATIESAAGSTLIENCLGNVLNYANGAAKVDVKKSQINKVNLTSETGNVFINDLTNEESTFETQNCTLDLKKLNTTNFINIKSVYESKVTLYEAIANQVNVLMNGGTFTGYYLTMNGKIQSTGSVMLSYITGNFEVEAYGRYCDIYEVIGETLSVKTQSTEATLKYIKANTIKYNGNNSTSLLYLVFGKDMIVQDSSGDIIFDNNKNISENETLYIKYYQKIERLNITSSASFNVDEDVKLGAWE